MKSVRTLVMGAFLAIGAFGTMTLTSCSSDECKDVECANGNCDEETGNCVCPTGYSGTLCETLWNAAYNDTWRTSTEACTVSGTNAQYDIEVSPSTSNAATIRIKGLYADNSVTVTANLSDANTFVIPSQAFGAGTISGSGTKSGTNLTISYTITVGAASDVCNNVVFTPAP